MTAAEKSICRAEKVARQIEKNEKYEGFALVWMGKHRKTVETFLAVKNGKEIKIAAHCDEKGNIMRLEEMPY